MSRGFSFIQQRPGLELTPFSVPESRPFPERNKQYLAKTQLKNPFRQSDDSLVGPTTKFRSQCQGSVVGATIVRSCFAFEQRRGGCGWTCNCPNQQSCTSGMAKTQCSWTGTDCVRLLVNQPDCACDCGANNRCAFLIFFDITTPKLSAFQWSPVTVDLCFRMVVSG